MKRLCAAAGFVVAIAMATTLLNNPPLAADHGDPPAASANAKADIGDLFSWLDGANLVMVMTVESDAAPGTGFSDAVHYAFQVNRVGVGGGAGVDTEFICKFDSTDNTDVRCWLGDAATNTFIAGDPSNAASPLVSSGVTIFAGLRDDPFFFNAAGFAQMAKHVNATFLATPAALNLNAQGCPDLSGGLGADLMSCLTTKCDQALGGVHAAGENDFAGHNVLALVVSIPLTMINGSGDDLKVSASTHLIAQ